MATQAIEAQKAASDTSNNDQGDSAFPLALVVGVTVAAAAILILIIVLLVLWRKGKLPKPGRRQSSSDVVMRRDTTPARPRADTSGSDTLREEKKKSIVVVAPTEGSDLYVGRHYYRAEDASQLTVETGRIVAVLEKMDNGWWRGVTGGNEGWFPATFVRKIDVSEPHSTSPTIVEVEICGDSDQSDAPADQTCYVNGAFHPEGSSRNHGDEGRDEGDNKLGRTESAKHSQSADPRVQSARTADGLQHNESVKLKVMETGDIEGYLNEIFTVEDEMNQSPGTPTTKTGKKHSFRPSTTGGNHSNKGSKYDNKGSNHDNKASRKKPRLLTSISDPRTSHENRKNARLSAAVGGRHLSLDAADPTNPGLRGSPLINPVHYMISSSESLISSDDPDGRGLHERRATPDRIATLDRGNFPETRNSPEKRKSPKSRTTCSDNKSVSQDHSSQWQAGRQRSLSDEANHGDNKEADRGTPDGSSLQEVLPDGKELTCSHGKELTAHSKEIVTHRTDTKVTSGQQNGTDDIQDVETVDGKNDNSAPSKRGTSLKSELSFASNLKHQLKKRAGRRAYVVMYPFSPTDPSQLSLERNDVVLALGPAENGWIKGEKRGSGDVGWVPASYVREGKSPPAADLLSEESETPDSDGEFEEDDTIGREYRALYPYEAQQDGDLTLQAGDILVVTETLDNGWWRGCHGDREGWFPGSYVEAVAQTIGGGVYEDIGVPFHLSQPLSTSSPVERGNKRQSLPATFESDIRPETTPQLRQSPQRSQRDARPTKRQSMPPPSSSKKPARPDPPQRSVAQRPSGTPRRPDKPGVKPSRPPPPVPRAGYRPAGRTNVRRPDNRKRASLPRPSDPPPPIPTVEGSEPDIPPPDTSTLDTPDSAHTSNTTQTSPSRTSLPLAGPFFVEDPDDQLLARIKKSSLPGVHRSPRSSLDDSRGEGNPEDGPDSVTKGTDHHKFGSIDQESSSPSVADSSLHKDSTLSFNSIMTIFEKIVSKESLPGSQEGETTMTSASSKPPVPPKPEDKHGQFRRTKSDPDILPRRAERGYSLPPGDDQSQDELSSQRHPQRPKDPPQRSKSTGSLMSGAMLGLLSASDLSDKDFNKSRDKSQTHELSPRPEPSPRTSTRPLRPENPPSRSPNGSDTKLNSIVPPVTNEDPKQSVRDYTGGSLISRESELRSSPPSRPHYQPSWSQRSTESSLHISANPERGASVKTNPLRFFTPQGYSPRASSEPRSSVAADTHRHDDHCHHADAPHASLRLRTPSPARPGPGTDHSDPLRFYTPAGYRRRRNSGPDTGHVTTSTPGHVTSSLPSVLTNSYHGDTTDRAEIRNTDVPKLHQVTGDSGLSNGVINGHTNGHTDGYRRLSNGQKPYAGDTKLGDKYPRPPTPGRPVSLDSYSQSVTRNMAYSLPQYLRDNQSSPQYSPGQSSALDPPSSLIGHHSVQSTAPYTPGLPASLSVRSAPYRPVRPANAHLLKLTALSNADLESDV